MVKAAKYREMSTEELEDQLDQFRTELFNLRVQNTTKELQDTSKIPQARREIARILTLLDEKRRGEAAGSKSEERP
jgi:large subunit ribosomal protein L29